MKSSHSLMEDVDKFVEELPKAKFMEVWEFNEWEGYWFIPPIVKAAIEVHTRFEARNDDVLLASSMKTGTTWLKALLHCIINQRQNHQTLDSTTHDALTLENPHFLIPTVETVGFMDKPLPFDVYDASGPRLLHTHLPHVLLPETIKNSDCKIVYVARNPKDTLISSWLFHNTYLRQDQEPFQLEKFVDGFCSGMHPYGPFVEHVAEYWEESKKRPEKVLFVKYQELKKDQKKEVMKIAEFLERPLDVGGEGEVNEVVFKCSFKRLKNLEVNKSGSRFINTSNSSFFWKGEVGDCKNYLTPKMEMKIDRTIGLKLETLGLCWAGP